MTDKKSVFIVSRIGQEDSPERHAADEWLECIVVPVCDEMNLVVERADDISTPGRIDSQIAQRLLNADLVIADLTGLNANVMYEIGVRHGLDLPLVQMASDDTVLPFDVNGMRTLLYDPKFNNRKVERDRERLSKMILEALDGKGSAFLPKPSEAPYTGVVIEGSWEVVFPEEKGHRRKITLELKQKGELIRGMSIHTKNDPEIYGDDVRTYLQEGHPLL